MTNHMLNLSCLRVAYGGKRKTRISYNDLHGDKFIMYKLYNNLVVQIVLYEYNTWRLFAETEKKFQGFKNACICGYYFGVRTPTFLFSLFTGK